jgi:hypothetical protein
MVHCCIKERSMTGIILIGVLAAWLMAAMVIGAKMGDKLNPPWVRTPAALLLMAVLIPLPVADEIIGRFQFKALCEKNGISEAKLTKAKGMTLNYKSSPFVPIEGTILNVTGQKIAYVDPLQSIPIVEYTDYRSEGGWLINSLHISETHAPLIFESSCRIGNYTSLSDLLRLYQIKIVFNR